LRVRRKEYGRQKEAADQAHKDWENLVGLSQEVSRLATRYRQVWSPPTNDDEGSDSTTAGKSATTTVDYEEIGPLALRREVVKLLGALHEVTLLHKDDDGNLVSVTEPAISLDEERQRLMASENIFRGLCRGIQDLGQAACKMYKHESIRHNVTLVDLAESALLTLAEIRTDRTLLFRQLEEASSDTTKVTAKDEADAPSPTTTPSSSSWLAPFAGLASFVSNSISKITNSTATTTSSKETILSTLAHEDPSLDPTLASFRMVVGSIALASMDPTAAKHLKEPEKRVVQLLQVLPDDVYPDSRTLLNILEILCHGGSLEAAQEGRRLFEEYSPTLSHVGFSLVLRGYLEAGRKETDSERQAVVVQEILDVFQSRWDGHSPPRHLAERIAQGSSVLHCLAVSGSCDDLQAKTSADIIVRRILGGEGFDELNQTIMTANSKVEGPNVPLVNFLSRFYATSSQAKFVNLAKDMFRCILPRENDASGQYIKYPNIETINTLLESMLRLHQEGTEEMDMEADLAFADDLLKFAMSRREAGIWANAETFDSLMSLYALLRPDDLGQRMEKLLSNYEARVYFSPQPEMKVPLTTYNRVIRALVLEAQHDEPRRASSRALAILEKLEVLSTPLLLSRKDVFLSNEISLYDFDLQPTKKTLDNVLNVCEKTASAEEFELAACVAHKVGRRMVQNSAKTNSPVGKVSWRKMRVCMKRLAPTSPNRDRLETLMEQKE
jgi:hypothetical protein